MKIHFPTTMDFFRHFAEKESSQFTKQMITRQQQFEFVYIIMKYKVFD